MMKNIWVLVFALGLNQYLCGMENTVLIKKRSLEYASDEEVKKQKLSNDTREEKEQYEEAFNRAPTLLKTLISGISEHDADLEDRFKYILIAGDDNNYKILLAKAIAHKLNRDFLLIPAESLLGDYKEESIENMAAVFAQLHACKQTMVLIFDGIDALVDLNKHDQAEILGSYLSYYLDQFEKLENTFIICTSKVTRTIHKNLKDCFKWKVFLPK